VDSFLNDFTLILALLVRILWFSQLVAMKESKS
jgi:hypothetical protein